MPPQLDDKIASMVMTEVFFLGKYEILYNSVPEHNASDI